MTRLILDTSIVIKWFHSDGENEVEAARAIRHAHVAGDVDCYFLDLGLYEIGNVLVRSLRWPARAVADQLDDVLAILGTPLVMSSEWMRDAATLAARHKLTFYDASWAAAAKGMSAPLVSADDALRRAGLALSATEAARQLNL